MANAPRENQTRYYGLLSAHHKYRQKLVSLVPKTAAKPADAHEEATGVPQEPAEPVPKKYRQPWSALLKRVFGREMLVCPKCKGKMRLLGMVDSPEVIEKVLAHLGLETEVPKLAPARSPPQLEFDEVFGDDDRYGGCDIDEAA